MMHFVRAILATSFLYVCQGKIVLDIPTNGTRSNETISSRQAGYGLIRFEGPSVHGQPVTFAGGGPSVHGQPVTFAGGGPSIHGQTVGFAAGSPSVHGQPVTFAGGGPSVQGQPLTFSGQGLSIHGQSVTSYPTQNHLNPGFTAQNSNQISGEKKRRKKRKRKSRRIMDGNRNVSYGQYGQPITPQQLAARPALNEMSGPLRVISDALESIIQNDSKRCVRRMLCEQAATNDQIHNSTLMQTMLRVFQYIPLLKRTAALNALPLANSVGVMSVAMRYGAAARNASACQQRYPDCPDDPEQRIHYLNNHQGGLFRFFRGNDQHQYTATEFHNQLLQLGLKPQPHPVNAYGLYQPQYAANSQQLAHPYPSYYGNQQSNAYASEQYGVRQPYSQPNTANSYGLYHNQIPAGTSNQYSNPYAGQFTSNQQSPSVYGPAYPHNRRFVFNGVDFKIQVKDIANNNIHRRIQNKPEVFTDVNNNYGESKWIFPKPENAIYNIQSNFNNVRGGRDLKFPDNVQGQETFKQAQGFSFPGAQSNRQHTTVASEIFADHDLKFENPGVVNAANEVQNAINDDGSEVVYVVRGNGDPRYPEIIKVRPGEKI